MRGIGGGDPLSRREDRSVLGGTDQFRKLQARSRVGGEVPVTAARRAIDAERTGAVSAMGGAAVVGSLGREARASRVESPGGRAATEP
ncbi:MAG: hypothetical protein IPP07_31875 [Holophagales bacterium]|nr:hypothetical protein [Holophagales bacterium]